MREENSPGPLSRAKSPLELVEKIFGFAWGETLLFKPARSPDQILELQGAVLSWHRRAPSPRNIRSTNSNRLPAASPTTASATVAAAISASTSAAVSAVAPAASSVLGLRPRLIHVECSSADLRAVQRGDGLLAIFVIGHFHKAETARAPGIPVGHDADAVYWSERLKNPPQFVFRCIEIQVPHENILQASTSCNELPKCELDAVDWQVGDAFLKIDTGAGGS